MTCSQLWERFPLTWSQANFPDEWSFVNGKSSSWLYMILYHLSLVFNRTFKHWFKACTCTYKAINLFIGGPICGLCGSVHGFSALLCSVHQWNGHGTAQLLSDWWMLILRTTLRQACWCMRNWFEYMKDSGELRPSNTVQLYASARKLWVTVLFPVPIKRSGFDHNKNVSVYTLSSPEHKHIE